MYRPIPQSLSDSDSDKELQMDSVNVSFSKTHRLQSDGKPAKLDNIFQTKLRKPPKKLSAKRKLLLAFSIVLCFITIVVFLWVLPCSGDQICPIQIPNWNRHINGLEFRGSISIISEHMFGICFKNSFFAEKNGGGAAALYASTGDIAWFNSKSEQTLGIDCSILDVNGDGKLDCLIQKETCLEAVDSKTGTTVWNMHSHLSKPNVIEDVDMPIVVDDLNGDGVHELLTVIGINGQHNVLALLSGKTGMTVHEYVVKACPEIHITKYDKQSLIHSCKNGTHVAYYKILFMELKKAFLDHDYKVQALESNYSASQETTYTIGSKILRVNNTGHCPDCIAEINVLNSNNTLLFKRYDRTLIMKPKIFTFRETKQNKLILKGHLQGYILKLWTWSHTFNRKQFIKNMTVESNLIREQIVIITCNETDIHVINASITELAQLCYQIVGTDEYECQPDVQTHDSIFIGDIDDNGSQDIINYSSSFVENYSSNDTSDVWTLTSSIQIFHLESELPKLFSSAN